jgi:predicted phage terminase large subunit-like protein
VTLAPNVDAAFFARFAEALNPQPKPRRWATPGELAKALDPGTVQTSALDLIDAALVDVADGRCDRLMISVPPQEGKSVRISRRFPEWLLARNPDLRIAIVSYAHGVARRHGRAIRDDIAMHSASLGISVSPNSSAAHDWDIAGHIGNCYSVGIAGSLTSRPVDVLIIDDPYKNGEQADSKAWTDTVRDFWTEVAVPRLGPGAVAIIVQTRWRADDLSGWLQDEDTSGRWRVINIPAQADHDPRKGETDPLGREPGKYLVSARGRTVQDWEQRKQEVGSRVWNALFQGRPSPAEGNIFQREWWQFYGQPQWVDLPNGAREALSFDQVITSWDMTFKSTDGTDFVCGQVWGRRGSRVYLLDQIHRRMTFVETCQAVRELAAKWPQSTAKLVEDKANGSAVINFLSRTVPGLVPVEPDGSKVARAAAVSPFVEAGNVFLPAPELCPWISDLVEEAAGFPNSAHDDRVDSMSQAINRLLINPLFLDDQLVVEDEDDGPPEGSISAY